jgi:hypothetical protein
MTVELERVLREKCEADDRLRLLQAQWEYDRRLVGEALQNVGSTFPHYSKHDASHSDSILLQITRVLGDRVGQVSATDIWLMLEAAYWHDSGMIVDADTARNWWSNDADFKKHLEKLKSSEDSMLAGAARIVTSELRPSSEHWPLQVRKAVTLVLADYGRSKHADRSGHAVRHPLLQGIHSPRTLIPQRLFEWLAEIAVRHGGSFDEVMALPYAEGGLGMETCHPRFVAFMLRLGDLLDLDNGRFCEVMSRSIGSLPTSSLDHVGKHASIRHFSVSPEKVEVTAICQHRDGVDPYGAYEAVSSWLDWLKQELRDLAANWVVIAPPRFGGAPSLGVIEASLDGYISLERGRRPRFSVDESAFLRLVRSNNLYGSKHAWVRELLANAEDATLLRLHQQGGIPTLDANKIVNDPYSTIVQGLKDYTINVDLSQNTDTVCVRISDSGTGISEKDLRYMLAIGSSRRNPERRLMIGEMPEYARPTGNFGIGLQSVFLVANEVEIRSMHFKTRDRLHIKIRRSGEEDRVADLLSPAAERAGVYIRRLREGEGPIQAGTIIEFKLPRQALEPEDTLESPGMVNLDLDSIYAARGGAELDRLDAEVKSSALTMFASIKINGESVQPGTQSAGIQLFDPRTCLVFRFQEPTRRENRIDLFYRGAKVLSHNLLTVPILKIDLDAKFGGASDIVAASRETLTSSGEQVIEKRFREGLGHVFQEYVDQLSHRTADPAKRPDGSPMPPTTSSLDRLQLASLFAKVYLHALPGRGSTEWQQISLFNDPSGARPTLETIAKQAEVRIYVPFSSRAPHPALNRMGDPWYTPTPESTRSSHSGTGGLGYSNRIAYDAILSLFPHSQLIGMTTAERQYLLSRDPAGQAQPQVAQGAAAPETTKDVIDRLVDELRYLPELEGRTQRVVWPLIDGYEYLAIDTSGAARFNRTRRLPREVQDHTWLVHRVIVLPLEFRFSDLSAPAVSADHLDAYVRWAEEHCDGSRDNEQRKAGIFAETQKLIELICSKLGQPLINFKNEPFTPDVASRILASLRPQQVSGASVSSDIADG